jgi:hypothetical protein
MEQTWNGKALVVTLLFRLLFGGYIVGMDQYHFNDLESAWTVLVIYTLIAIFTTLFIFGKKIGLLGVISLESFFIVLNSVFLILTLGQIAEAGMHDPVSNWWATFLRYLFSIMTLIFSIRVYREK